MGIFHIDVAHRFEPRATFLAKRRHGFIYHSGGDALSSMCLGNEQQRQSADQPMLERGYDSPGAASDDFSEFSNGHAGFRLERCFQVPGHTEFVQPYPGQLSHQRNERFRVGCRCGADEQLRLGCRRRGGP